MKKLNEQATRIFCRILKRMGGQDYLKLKAEGYMPLTAEKIAVDIDTPWGKGYVISLCHYYEQNGDLMRDPEMCFIVADNRKQGHDYECIAIYPQMYRQDNMGVYEESIHINDGKVTGSIIIWQAAHALFANSWLRNIRRQGFLK